MKLGTLKILLVFCLCIGMLFQSTGTVMQVYASDAKNSSSQAELDSLNKDYDKLKKEQDALEAKLKSAKTEKDKQLLQKQSLDEQIKIIKEQIALLGAKIGYLNSEITNKQGEIVNKEGEITTKEGEIGQKLSEIGVKQQDIDETYGLFKDRMRATYMSGNQTSLTVLLTSASFFDFLARSEMMARVAKRDKDMLETLDTQKTELQEMKTDLENDKVSLENDKLALESAKMALEDTKKEVENVRKEENDKNTVLDGQVKEVNSHIHSLAAMEKEFMANKAELQKQAADLKKEMDKIYASMQSTGDFVGGDFQWPVPGHTMITSRFGWRFNNTDFHTGMDIAGGSVYGKNIVAANAGTVYMVNYDYKKGKGAGIYLILDHGGGYSTMYAHCSEIVVKQGEKVTKGQTIAKVGSTGWSTGPHLHFEVRINGKEQNPENYTYSGKK